MKTLRTVLYFLQSVVLGLVLAAGYLLWTGNFNLNDLQQRLGIASAQVSEAPLTSPLGKGPFSYADAVASSSPSVVTIYTSKTVKENIHPILDDPLIGRLFAEQLKRFKRDKTETNLGSGVIMTPSGYVLTNQHVIDDAEEILVSLADGRSGRAELIGEDRETDIAVLHIAMRDLQSISIANSENQARVGDVVLAIGNPLNVGQTVTMGIISATGRNRLGLNTFENFIQTDAAINPGNSGGALINARGDLIGINTAIFSQSGGSQGIGFAIPVALALDVMQSIIQTGRVSRGWLGVEGTSLSARAAAELGNENLQGVLILGVFIGSPADIAGIEAGDVITAIDDKPVTQVRNVLETIAGHKPGDNINLEIWRSDRYFEVSLIATERPA